jgi:hypothetical protein
MHLLGAAECVVTSCVFVIIYRVYTVSKWYNGGIITKVLLYPFSKQNVIFQMTKWYSLVCHNYTFFYTIVTFPSAGNW